MSGRHQILLNIFIYVNSYFPLLLFTPLNSIHTATATVTVCPSSHFFLSSATACCPMPPLLSGPAYTFLWSFMHCFSDPLLQMKTVLNTPISSLFSLFLFGFSGLLPQCIFVPTFSTLNLLLNPDDGNSILF